MYQLNFASGSVSNANPLPVTVSSAPTTSVKPAAAQQDPVGKFRVSMPQTLIDTDFEYGSQPLKWEFLNLVQNKPNFFAKGQTTLAAFTLSSLAGGNQAPYSTITGASTGAHGLVPGDVIFVQGASNQNANGVFVLQTASGTAFTYQARGQINGSVFVDNVQTVVYGGGVYSNAAIPMTSAAGDGASPSVITVTTTSAHGLLPGTQIIINNATTTSVNGRWVITRVASPTTFTFTCGTNAVTTVTLGSAALYTSPDGVQQQLATIGGISLTTGTNFIGTQSIRQTRRNFKYQPGKGMCLSTGAKFTPTFDVLSITGSGTVATITTETNHNLQIGATVKIDGATVASGTNYYNGNFSVVSITSTTSFTVSMIGTPTDLAPLGTNVYCTAIAWTGAVVRQGVFDDQNGMYFEYDGATLYCVQRTSNKQLAGRIACTNNTVTITGTNTKFRSQLLVQDTIVIRGMTYEVIGIASDTSMTISPAYRGGSITSDIAMKVQNTRYPQSAWNLDKMDGTGTSAYTIDISKMQMSFIDYSWYGAGTIRFGFRATNGDVTYCHQLSMNNNNYKAYMRAGNLPGRYEANNYGPYSRLVAGLAATRGTALASTDTTMYIENALYWPASGYVFVGDGTNAEIIQYAAIGAYNATAGGYPLTGLTRRASYTLAGINVAGTFSTTAYTVAGTASSVTFTPDASVGGAGTSQVSVALTQNTCAPVITHWGVSMIIDGGYQQDKSTQYTAGMLRYANVTASNVSPLIAMRLAPSADNGITGALGARQILNRMQVNFVNMGISSQGQFLVEGILNPVSVTGNTLPTDWAPVPGGSLSQTIYFNGTSVVGVPVIATANVVGGDRIFGFYTENGGGVNYSATMTDLTSVRDLGTSILSGDGTATAPSYPNGPDILVIVARNLSSTNAANIACRVSWTESQA